jgi:hypothetical protein
MELVSNKTMNPTSFMRHFQVRDPARPVWSAVASGNIPLVARAARLAEM